tara:strand:+ start:43 stop:321 length:279 start_codon:yes stop_codon:yes gene_type:complete
MSEEGYFELLVERNDLKRNNARLIEAVECLLSAIKIGHLCFKEDAHTGDWLLAKSKAESVVAHSKPQEVDEDGIPLGRPLPYPECWPPGGGQ